MTESIDSRSLVDRLRREIERAERTVQRLTRMHRLLVIGGLSLTAVATVVAGWASASGPPVGSGTEAWRYTCGAIAIFTAAAGLLTGLNERFDFGGRLSSARTCAVRLRALELSLTVGARGEADVARQYEEILSQHPGFDL